jgi:uncharacterized protein (DUF924 family)
MTKQEIKKILDFWFGDLSKVIIPSPEKISMWFKKSTDLDQEIKENFEPLLKATSNNPPTNLSKPNDYLATIILLDQFSRNIYRDSPLSFEEDALALSLTEQAIEKKLDTKLKLIERVFLYMPMMHSEDPLIQEQSVEYFGKLTFEAPTETKKVFEEYLSYAQQHKNIIDRFDRYPHRNKLLNRETTKQEEGFLLEKGSSF